MITHLKGRIFNEIYKLILTDYIVYSFVVINNNQSYFFTEIMRIN